MFNAHIVKVATMDNDPVAIHGAASLQDNHVGLLAVVDGGGNADHQHASPRMPPVEQLLGENLLQTTEVSVIRTVSIDSLRSTLAWVIDSLTALQQVPEQLSSTIASLEAQQQHVNARVTELEVQARVR